MVVPVNRKRTRCFLGVVACFVTIWVYLLLLWSSHISTYSEAGLPTLKNPAPSRFAKKFGLSLSNLSKEDSCGLQQFMAPYASATEAFLIFGIPTVPRNPERGYLSQALTALADQIPQEMDSKIKVLVVNNRRPGENHSIFDQEQLSRSGDNRFVFRQESRKTSTSIEADIETRDKPGPKVRQQTRDIVQTLRVAWETFHPQHYVIMEDDFAFCQEGVYSVAYMIDRATKSYGDWLAVRFSYGFNGVLIHGKDLLPLANYLESHYTRRPPDHLLVEWFAGETSESAAYKSGRVHSAFRFNILDHLGEYSTLRGPRKTPYLACWKELRVPIVFEVEAYKSRCSRIDMTEDLWPCLTSPTNHCLTYGVRDKIHRG